MRNSFYIILGAFILLVLESTFFRWVSFFAFDFLGLRSIAGLCFDGAFMICVYIALTRKFNQAIFMAFILGYLKDIFILPSLWVNPFLFVACAFISNILRNLFIMRGAGSFSLYIFFISILYSLMWVMICGNVGSAEYPFMIGIVIMLPHAIVNFIFAPIIYFIIAKIDRQSDESRMKGFLTGKI